MHPVEDLISTLAKAHNGETVVVNMAFGLFPISLDYTFAYSDVLLVARRTHTAAPAVNQVLGSVLAQHRLSQH